MQRLVISEEEKRHRRDIHVTTEAEIGVMSLPQGKDS